MNEPIIASTTASPGNNSGDSPVGMEQRGFVPAGVQPTGIAGRPVLWPTAIGSVSIAMGIVLMLGIIGNLLSIGITILASGSIDGLLGYGLWDQVATCAQLLKGLNGGLLLAAGVLLTRHAKKGPGMHKLFAILAIITGIAGPLAHISYWITDWHSMYWMIWPAAMNMVFPVFLLIWFCRPRIKRQVAQWGKPDRAMAIAAGNASGHILGEETMAGQIAVPNGGACRRALWPVGIGAVSFALAVRGLLILTMLLLLLGLDLILDHENWFREFLGGSLAEYTAWGFRLLRYLSCVILLPAGILAWRQSRFAPGMHRAYAIIGILLSLCIPLGHILSAPEQFGLHSLLGAIWPTTVAMVYPVFLLIWFARAKVKAETRLWP